MLWQLKLLLFVKNITKLRNIFHTFSWDRARQTWWDLPGVHVYPLFLQMLSWWLMKAHPNLSVQFVWINLDSWTVLLITRGGCKKKFHPQIILISDHTEMLFTYNININCHVILCFLHRGLQYHCDALFKIRNNCTTQKRKLWAKYI